MVAFLAWLRKEYRYLARFLPTTAPTRNPPTGYVSLYADTNGGLKVRKSDGTIVTPGSGTSNHASLTNLTWTASGHTGTASRLAAFDGTGAAAYLQLGASGGPQAWDADLDAIAALSSTGYARRTGTNTWSVSASVPWSDVSSTPTTIAGYGLTDAVSTSRSISTSSPLTGGGNLSADRTLGITVGSAGGVQAWDSELDAIAALSTNGLIARTGTGAAASRTLTAGSAQVTVANGSGAAGNPTVDLAYASNLRETAGPTTLSMGAIADGQYLRRSGTSIVGVALALAIRFDFGDFFLTEPGVKLASVSITAGTVA